MKIVCEEKHLSIQLERPSKIASWCVINGGLTEGREVFWAEVKNSDLSVDIDVKEYLRGRWKAAELSPDIAFLTSASVCSYVYKQESFSDLIVDAISTVGLGNALRVGDKTQFDHSVGTINILVEINQELTEAALMEAMNIATEAKATAVLDSGVLSTESKMSASGTGTDCVAVASNVVRQDGSEHSVDISPVQFCGKHTKLGEIVGRLCYQIVSDGICKWKQTDRS